MDQLILSKEHDTSKQTSSEWLIDEVLDDETGYDADVEILRPDAYEEPDSDRSDDGASSTESDERSRNDLVRHMKSLSCNSKLRIVSKEADPHRGRKRRSTDAFGASLPQVYTRLADDQVEVTEVVDEQDSKGPMKRVRRRRRISHVANGVVRVACTTDSERGERSIGKREKKTASEESTTLEIPNQTSSDDKMDLD